MPLSGESFSYNLELRPRLREAKRSVSTVERLNQETEEGLTDLLLGLDMLPDGGYGDRAQEAAMKAMDAQQRAEDAANKIEGILDKLPEDQRKINEIPKDIADANRDMQRAQNQGKVNISELKKQQHQILPTLCNEG